jgi:hypothetical protein
MHVMIATADNPDPICDQRAAPDFPVTFDRAALADVHVVSHGESVRRPQDRPDAEVNVPPELDIRAHGVEAIDPLPQRAHDAAHDVTPRPSARRTPSVNRSTIASFV